jgi:hypothetical protein
MAPRDRWIGWTPKQRARNLQIIVNNSRFLVLPWHQLKSLASELLERASRRLPADWSTHYGHEPVLADTLVDPSLSILSMRQMSR